MFSAPGATAPLGCIVGSKSDTAVALGTRHRQDLAGVPHSLSKVLYLARDIDLFSVPFVATVRHKCVPDS